MAEKKSDQETKTTTTPVGGVNVNPLDQPASGGAMERAGAGGISRSAAGGSTLALDADVSQQLLDAAPVFGDILRSVGNGVAASQTSLDASIVNTVQTLNNTKIDVVTDVVEQLDDDGLPNVAQTQLLINKLSLLNFFTPTVHEWKNVQISMDLEIGALDNERGMQFTKKQSSASANAVGLFWGFLGWFDMGISSSTQSSSSSRTDEVAWTRGQVRLDALLGPRRTTKFPVPASVTIGPQIFVSQGSTQETTNQGQVTSRSVDLLITVRKKDGSVNPNINLVLDAGGLLPAFKTDGGFTGSTTNAEGKVQVKLTRNLAAGFGSPFQRDITASLGQVRKTVKVTI